MKFQIVNQILSKSFSGGKDFCPNPVEKQKPNHEIFGVFQNLEKFSLKIYFQEKKKFLK